MMISASLPLINDYVYTFPHDEFLLHPHSGLVQVSPTANTQEWEMAGEMLADQNVGLAGLQVAF